MTPRSGSDPSIDSSKEIFSTSEIQESSALDSATPSYDSAQNDSILRGFLNPGSDV